MVPQGIYIYSTHPRVHDMLPFEAVAVHGTSYVNVIGNVAFDIVGHM